MLQAALTTAAGRQATSASPATASMSMWSMIAMSPGRSRLVRFLVRRSIRAGPVTPGPPSGAGRRRTRGILTGRWSHASSRRCRQLLTRPVLAGPAALAGPRRGTGSDRRPLLLGRLEELARVRLRRVGLGHPAEHARELADAPVGVERGDAADG